jgi:hypothetical protein
VTPSTAPTVRESFHDFHDFEDALKALAGWNCSQCHSPLRAGTQYVCCDHAHCPFCGLAYCEHYAASKTWSAVRLRGITVAGQLALPKSNKPEEGSGLAAVKGWTAQERRAVFGTAADLLEAVFGDDLSAPDGWDTNRVKATIIEQVMRPERHVRYRIASRHYHQAWFCRDGAEVTARAAQALADLRAGVKKLRDRERARERRQKQRQQGDSTDILAPAAGP